MRHSCALFLVLLICSGCNTKPDTLVDSGYDEQEMQAAIVRAQSEVDSFIAELSNPTGDSHAVKAPIEDAGDTEYFWLIDVNYQDGAFHGTINNDPGIVSNVQFGQQWTVNKAEISD